MKDRFGWAAEQYRSALNDLERAITQLGIADLVQKWGEPRHEPWIGVNLPTSAGCVYQVYDAYMVANQMMNRNGDET